MSVQDDNAETDPGANSPRGLVASVDLKDTYFHIQIALHHRCFLRGSLWPHTWMQHFTPSERAGCAFSTGRSGRLSIAVFCNCIKALRPWRNPDLFSQGIPLGLVTSCVMVMTDALPHGWGAVCEGMPTAIYQNCTSACPRFG